MRTSPLPSLTLVLSWVFALLASAHATADEGAVGTELERLLAGFGKLHVAAGKHASLDNDHDWRTTMEGSSATAADLSRPHMAMADAVGNIYIADKESSAIRKVDVHGTITTVAGLNLSSNAAGNGADSGVATTIRLDNPNGLYTLPDGTTYILDTGNGKVRKLNTDGTMATILTDPSGFGAGRGLWVSPDESVIFYAASTAVKRWTPGGGITVWATGFTELANIDVDPTDGNVVATDRTLHRVYRIVAGGSAPYSGTANPIAGSGATGRGVSGVAALSCALDKVRGVAFRPDGTYFIASQESGSIWFVDSANLIWRIIDGDDDKDTHGGNGQPLTVAGLKISEPRAVAIAPNGDLLVTENDRGIIRRVTNICVSPRVVEFHRYPVNTIVWQSHREGSYQVESSPNLIDGNDVATANGGVGSTTEVVDSEDATLNLKLFYRVLDVTP